jgi:mRNA interferase RelE/StbE
VIVKLNKKAKKQMARLGEPMLSRIAEGIDGLEHEPPEGDIKKLQGRDGYRVRVGGCRILFDIKDGGIDVFGIERRGQAYKKEQKK